MKTGLYDTVPRTENEVDKTFNYFSVVIIIGSVTFMGLSFSLYILSSRLSTKRIGMLE